MLNIDLASGVPVRYNIGGQGQYVPINRRFSEHLLVDAQPHTKYSITG